VMFNLKCSVFSTSHSQTSAQTEFVKHFKLSIWTYFWELESQEVYLILIKDGSFLKCSEFKFKSFTEKMIVTLLENRQKYKDVSFSRN